DGIRRARRRREEAQAERAGAKDLLGRRLSPTETPALPVYDAAAETRSGKYGGESRKATRGGRSVQPRVIVSAAPRPCVGTSPSPSCETSSGFGRSRGSEGVVRGTPTQIASSSPSIVAPRNSTPRISASACATEGGPANAAATERSSGSERRIAARTPPGRTP